MTSEKEIRERQQNMLFDLLKLVQDYPNLANHKGIQGMIKKPR